MREKGYDFLDVAYIVAASAEKMQSDFFVDQDHYTPEGHRRVTEVLAKYIKKNYLVDSTPESP